MLSKLWALLLLDIVLLTSFILGLCVGVGFTGVEQQWDFPAEDVIYFDSKFISGLKLHSAYIYYSIISFFSYLLVIGALYNRLICY